MIDWLTIPREEWLKSVWWMNGNNFAGLPHWESLPLRLWDELLAVHQSETAEYNRQINKK